ncbi:MAG: KOW motif-containing protein [Bacteroidales bacterium]|nr:KOW motif-containing protein [Bacteroidales bacterium]
MDKELHWYALRVFWNRVGQVKEMLDAKDIEYYSQTILPSYVFVHTDLDTLETIRKYEYDNDLHRFFVYWDKEKHLPVVVPDKELEIFRIVTSAGSTGLQFLGEDPSVYQQGDKVRVTDGPFMGAEGYIKRIKKDRRLVVTISGVAAIATSFIPPELLEKI